MDSIIPDTVERWKNEAECQKILKEESHEHHKLCVKTLYDALGVSSEDGEIRFKWAYLALTDKLKEIDTLRAELEETRKIIIRHSIESLNQIGLSGTAADAIIYGTPNGL
jgi:hypothetical protein